MRLLRPRPRLVIPRLTADTRGPDILPPKHGPRRAPDGHGLSSLLLVMLDTCDVVMGTRRMCGRCESVVHVKVNRGIVLTMHRNKVDPLI